MVRDAFVSDGLVTQHEISCLRTWLQAARRADRNEAGRTESDEVLQEERGNGGTEPEPAEDAYLVVSAWQREDSPVSLLVVAGSSSSDS